jgi:hypothetical protein
MKIIKFALLLFASSFAMEKEIPISTSIFSLDEKGIQEFREGKEKLAYVARNINNASSNKFLAHLKDLAQKNDNQIRALFTLWQPIIKELHNLIISNYTCQKYYAEAENSDDDKKWQSWRNANNGLMVSFLEKKGMKCKNGTIYFTSTELIEANSNLDDETLNYYDASSFLIYYARQIQREKTKKDVSPIKIS